MPQDPLERINPWKWRPASQHLIQHDPQRVDVAARVAPFSFQFLGGDVFRCTYNLRKVRKRNSPCSGLCRDAEADQFDTANGIDHDVLRFEITVNDSMILNVVKYLADAEGDPYCAVWSNLSLAVKQSAQRCSLKPLHNYVVLSGTVLSEDFHDARAIQGLDDFFLAAKTIEK